MKHIRVACGIIERKGVVCAAQRSDRMSMPWKWEFPGGKIRCGESPEKCLQRELMEELGIEVRVDHELPVSEHTYSSFAVTLYPFVCEIRSGMAALVEHIALAWLHPEKLAVLDWAEADLPVLESYLASKGLSGKKAIIVSTNPPKGG